MSCKMATAELIAILIVAVIAVIALVIAVLSYIRRGVQISSTPSDTTVLSGTNTVTRIGDATAAIITNDVTSTSTTQAYSADAVNKKISDVSAPIADDIWKTYQDDIVKKIMDQADFYPTLVKDLTQDPTFIAQVSNQLLKDGTVIQTAVQQTLTTDGVDIMKVNTIEPKTDGGSVVITKLDAQNVDFGTNVSVDNLTVKTLNASTIASTGTITIQSPTLFSNNMTIGSSSGNRVVVDMYGDMIRGRTDAMIDATRLRPVSDITSVSNVTSSSNPPTSMMLYMKPSCSGNTTTMGVNGPTLRTFINTGGPNSTLSTNITGGATYNGDHYPIRSGYTDWVLLPYQSTTKVSDVAKGGINSKQVYAYANGIYYVGASTAKWTTDPIATVNGVDVLTGSHEQHISATQNNC